MHVFIVNDEPVAQTALASILAGRREVEGFDTARDATEAFDKLMRRNFDVLLLDIRTPEVFGIELLDQLTAHDRLLPTVVFVTSYQQQALAALKKHPVDYILKPFSNERVEEALDLAFRRSQEERAVRLAETVPQTLSRQKREKIAIKANGKILFIAPDDVLAVHAEGNYVLLQADAGSYLLRVPISSIAKKLKPYGFLQIHRSVLVNASLVEEVQPLPTGEYTLRIKGGKQYTVTRTYKNNLKDLALCWIGLDGFAE
ncbi:MAG: LytTR family DNA-binding domain-containing protein [Terracidiphilus sp.]